MCKFDSASHFPLCMTSHVHVHTHIANSTHPTSNGFAFWNLHCQPKVGYPNVT